MLSLRNVILLLILSANVANANIKAKTDKWLNDFNANANVTPPQAVKGQGSYYLSGGSYVARYGTGEVFKLVDFDPPRMSAGCNGVDMYFGGFSFIDADEFVEQLKQVADNGKGLIFMMGIKAVSPMFADQIEYIQGIVDQINQFRQDSCQAATAMIGGIGEKMGAKNLTCELNKMQRDGDDWADAKKSCQGNATAGIKQSTPEEQDKIAFSEGNLVWKALKEAGLGGESAEYKALIMNILGTIIRVNESKTGGDKPAQDQVITPMFAFDGTAKKDFDDLIALMVTGDTANKVKIVKCKAGKEQDCLELDDAKDFTVTGLQKEINKKLNNIVKKMKEDNAFTDDEWKLLGQFSQPIYPLLRYALAYNRGRNINSGVYAGYTKVLAELIVLENLSDVIDVIDKGSKNMEQGLREDKDVKKWLEQVNRIAGGINREKNKRLAYQENNNKMLVEIMRYDQMIKSDITKNFTLAAGWSKRF